MLSEKKDKSYYQISRRFYFAIQHSSSCLGFGLQIHPNTSDQADGN